jgi:hypothetical protein
LIKKISPTNNLTRRHICADRLTTSA